MITRPDPVIIFTILADEIRRGNDGTNLRGCNPQGK